ncbi:MAG TPA: P-loop NTPase fold protein [Pseudonocardiaceae bacterium]|nr:P-loop NTPase fold protein [Pseudonocardiaceae bacterium]
MTEFDSEGYSVGESAADPFVVLNDAPVGEGGNEDLMNGARTARRLADLIVASRASTPFALAVDAAWGMGKSSLLRQLKQALDPSGVESVWFNAWTGGSASALEGLLKSVLLRFDRNVIRRTVRSLARRTQLLSGLRVAAMVAASFFGLGRVVDDIWRVLAVDAKSRNEIKGVMHDAVQSWLARTDGPDATKLLVVFIDDLDRCPPSRIIEVCEAIKLYLDVPGMVFVLACDQTVLWQAVRQAAGADEAVEYLEKIIQLNYRIPAPSESRASALVQSYLDRSGTSQFFDDSMRNLVIERTGRNPRRIKRLINSFVLEYQLSPDWVEVGARQLIRIILLQHFYPDFYRMLVDPRVDDVVHDFLSYADFRAAAIQGRHWNPAWGGLFAGKDIKAPPADVPDDQLAGYLDKLEPELPVDFPKLFRDHDFVSLMESLREPLRSDRLRRLLRKPLAQNPYAPSGQRSPDNLRGLRLLWIDDVPAGNTGMAGVWSGQGVVVSTATNREEAVREIRRQRPDVVLSDITRFGDPNAGFDDLEYLHDEGIYDGPTIFYAGNISRARSERAEELGAVAITDNPAVVMDTLIELANGMRLPGWRSA